MTSMLRLCRAELRKIIGQRIVAGLALWIWPIGGIVIPLCLLVAAFMASKDNPVAPTIQWTDTALAVWNLPLNLFGRLLFIALAVAVFTGEYQWNTWRVIVPRSNRVQLLIAKFAVFTALVTVAFLVMSILITLGIGLVQAARGLPYPPELTSDTLQTFMRSYLVQIALMIVNTLIGMAFGALFAILLQSFLGGMIGALFFVGGELGFIVASTFMGLFLKAPQFASLSRFTPSMSITNIQSWVQRGVPSQTLIEGTPTATVGESFVILAVWLVILLALNLWIFQRQELK
jgi:ABC-2 type transport system permease protein